MSFSLGSSQDDLLRGLLSGQQAGPMDTGMDPWTMALLGVAQGAAKATATPGVHWASALAQGLAGGGQGLLAGRAQEKRRGLLENATADLRPEERQVFGLLSPGQVGPALLLRQQRQSEDARADAMRRDIMGAPLPPAGGLGGGMTMAAPPVAPREQAVMTEPLPAPRGAMPAETAALPGDPRARNAQFGVMREQANATLTGDDLARRMAEISAAQAQAANGMRPGTPMRANPGVDGVFAGLPAPTGAVPIINAADTGGAARPVVAPAAARPAPASSMVAAPGAAELAEARRLEGIAAMAGRGEAEQRMAQMAVQRATQLRSQVEAERARQDSRASQRENMEFSLAARREDAAERERARRDEMEERARLRREEKAAGANSFGNSAQGNAASLILNLAPRIASNEASPEEVMRFRMAHDIYTREQVDQTGARVPGLPVPPEARAALEALRQRDAAASDATGVPQTAAMPPAPPPRVETSDSGSTRTITPGQITPQAREASRKMDVEVGRVSDALAAFREALPNRGDTGVSAYMGNPRDPAAVRLNTAFNNLTTALRSEAFLNTGVLQPAEINILNRLLMNPQSMQGLMASREGYEAMLSEIEKFVTQGQARARQSAGIPVEPPRDAPAQSPQRLRFNPATGRIE